MQHTDEKQQNPTAERILDAARDLFFDSGFEAVTTEALARAASVSKTSIYKHFGNMEGVFTAVIEQAADELAAGLPTVTPNADAFWETLEQFGAQLLAFIATPYAANIHRLMMERARDHTEMTGLYYSLSFDRTQRDLAERFRQAQAQGYVAQSVCPETVADALLCAWEGMPFRRLELGLTEEPFPDPAGRARSVLNIFRAGIEAR
ncbi:MAG: TetR/AcrR family transcriptional regulator [Pseudomonadota bacterium]